MTNPLRNQRDRDRYIEVALSTLQAFLTRKAAR